MGKDYTAAEVFKIAEKDRAFYGENGGVTLSGGEPFLQAEETISFLKLCNENSIHTTVETCGYFSADILDRVVPLTDLFLWDIKDTDSQRHNDYTGVSNERILNNLFFADSLGGKTRIRCILLNGVNTNEQHYENVVSIVCQLKHCEGVEFIPYHSYGDVKSVALGRTNLKIDKWIPTNEQLEKAKEYLQNMKIMVF